MSPLQDLLFGAVFTGALFAAAIYTTPASVVPPAPTPAQAQARTQAYIDAQRADDATQHAVPDYAVAAGAQHAYRRMGSSPALRALAAEAQARAFDAAGTDGYAAAARHSMIVDELVRESN